MTKTFELNANGRKKYVETETKMKKFVDEFDDLLLFFNLKLIDFEDKITRDVLPKMCSEGDAKRLIEMNRFYEKFAQVGNLYNSYVQEKRKKEHEQEERLKALSEYDAQYVQTRMLLAQGLLPPSVVYQTQPPVIQTQPISQPVRQSQHPVIQTQPIVIQPEVESSGVVGQPLRSPVSSTSSSTPTTSPTSMVVQYNGLQVEDLDSYIKNLRLEEKK